MAQRLQVSESTIYGWVDRDYIPFLMAGDLVRFDPITIHSWMLEEADRKREKKRGLRAIRDKVTPALAAATGKEQSDDNPKTRNTLLLRFHDPQTEIQRSNTRGPHEGGSRASRDKIKTKIYERKYGKVSAGIPFTQFVRSTYLPWSRANKRSSSDDEFHAEVFCRHFANKSLSEIDHQMIEEFKIKRMQSITRYGRPRKTGIGEPGTSDSVWHFSDGC